MQAKPSTSVVSRILWSITLVVKIPRTTLSGVVIIVLATAYYDYDQTFMSYAATERTHIFQQLAYSYLLMLLLGVALAAYGLLRLLNMRIKMVKQLNSIPLVPSSLIPYVLSLRRYMRTLIVSAFLYGGFYSVITSIIVYQPTVNFSEAYAADIPSAILIPCCGPPLQVPIVTVYLTRHLGLLLIPLSLILLAVVSTLVGLNVALTFFAYGRLRRGGKGWAGGLGAIVGLFTGCPTCAGLFLAYVFGGAGAVAAATTLAQYQPLFIGVSLPVLMATPFLISRNLSKVFKEGCITSSASFSAPKTLYS
ncbi:MAG: hypothetical protein LYZ66_03670 [Nitrososphaerales archaeon]|nr:hypothetical protein [Nitrososphaerales archaeon]